jgi:hypothetical protein
MVKAALFGYVSPAGIMILLSLLADASYRCEASPSQYFFFEINVPPGTSELGTLYVDPANPSLGVLPGSQFFVGGDGFDDTFNIPVGRLVSFGANGDPVVLSGTIYSQLPVYFDPFVHTPEYDVFVLVPNTANSDQGWFDTPPNNEPNLTTLSGDGFWQPVNAAVPEPPIGALLISSIVAFGLARRRFKARSV